MDGLRDRDGFRGCFHGDGRGGIGIGLWGSRDLKLFVAICLSVPFPLLEMREAVDTQQRNWAIELAPVMRMKIDSDVPIEIA